MNKKTIIALGISFAIAAFTTAGLATPIQSQSSSFTDDLWVNFDAAPSGANMNVKYQSDNGVNISGPSIFYGNFNSEVFISSSNLLESGHPVITIKYPTKRQGTQTCKLVLTDGPHPLNSLHFEHDQVPTCPGLDVTDIRPDDLTPNGYQLDLVYDHD